MGQARYNCSDNGRRQDIPNNGKCDMMDDDAPTRLSISVSPKTSEMSSTGRDSKVNMVVGDTEVGDSTYHAS